MIDSQKPAIWRIPGEIDQALGSIRGQVVWALAALEHDRIRHAPKRTEVECPEVIKLDAMAGLVMI